MVSTSSPHETLTSEELIISGLTDQVKAIAGYESVIWKLRVGYVLVLNGALALVLKGSGNPLDILSNLKYSHPLFAIVCGISLTFFFIDFGYVRKKLKFVVARELLIDLACTPDFDPRSPEVKNCLKDILHIAGETRPAKLPSSAKAEYKEKKRWNLFWILLPIYTAIPLLCLIFSTASRIGQFAA
jgi:hypothetical protein